SSLEPLRKKRNFKREVKIWEDEISTEDEEAPAQVFSEEETVSENGSLDETDTTSEDNDTTEDKQLVQIYYLPNLQSLRLWIDNECKLYPKSPVLRSVRDAIDAVYALQDSRRILSEKDPPAIQPVEILELVFDVGENTQRPFLIGVIEALKPLRRLAIDVHYEACIQPSFELGDFFMGIEDDLSQFIEGICALMYEKLCERDTKKQSSEPEKVTKKPEHDTASTSSEPDKNTNEPGRGTPAAFRKEALEEINWKLREDGAVKHSERDKRTKPSQETLKAIARLQEDFANDLEAFEAGWDEGRRTAYEEIGEVRVPLAESPQADAECQDASTNDISE
ncbi:MAG: hypothetical protein Q9211_004725, partial [Gyalolechia sp. 1 TL-2023]